MKLEKKAKKKHTRNYRGVTATFFLQIVNQHSAHALLYIGTLTITLTFVSIPRHD